jgi:hypothetical protein
MAASLARGLWPGEICLRAPAGRSSDLPAVIAPDHRQAEDHPGVQMTQYSTHLVNLALLVVAGGEIGGAPGANRAGISRRAASVGARQQES